MMNIESNPACSFTLRIRSSPSRMGMRISVMTRSGSSCSIMSSASAPLFASPTMLNLSDSHWINSSSPLRTYTSSSTNNTLNITALPMTKNIPPVVPRRRNLGCFLLYYIKDPREYPCMLSIIYCVNSDISVKKSWPVNALCKLLVYKPRSDSIKTLSCISFRHPTGPTHEYCPHSVLPYR
ncbi:hypothetical protein D3C73_641690 [compost metagenome]